MNDQLVKLWIKDQISKIQRKMERGDLLTWVGRAKIEVLQDFYETFNLDGVNVEIEYHNEIWSGQWICVMLFGNYHFDNFKKKLP